MLLAQISDLHIMAQGTLAYGRVDTAAFLARAIGVLNALDPRPDAVLVTGDLVDAGGIDEYRHLRTLLDTLAIPWRVMAGKSGHSGWRFHRRRLLAFSLTRRRHLGM